VLCHGRDKEHSGNDRISILGFHVKDDCIDLDAEAWALGYEGEPLPKRARKDPRNGN